MVNGRRRTLELGEAMPMSGASFPLLLQQPLSQKISLLRR
jgi:hypothetical protein